MIGKRTGYLLAALIALIALSACSPSPPPPLPTPTATQTPAPTATPALTCRDCLTVNSQRIYPGSFTLGGKSTLPDGTCLHTQLFFQDEPLSWWPTDTCVTVQEGVWQVSVSLEESGAPYERPPEGGYTFLAYQEGRRIASDLFWIDYSGPPAPPTAVPTATDWPSPTPTATATPSPTVAPARRPEVPAGCIVRDADSQAHFNTWDGYCLRYPTGFDLDTKRAPDTVYVLGPYRSAGPDPIRASLSVRVETHRDMRSLADAVDNYVSGLRAFAPADGVFMQTLTVLGGMSAVWVEGLGKAEWESDFKMQRRLLAWHGERLYILRFYPDPGAFPEVAADMRALEQATVTSFSFLPQGFPEPEPPAGEDPDTTPPLSPEGALRIWETPRLVFQRADQSLWASALDGSEPWPLVGPPTGEMGVLLWKLSPDGRWIAVVQSAGLHRVVRSAGQHPAGQLPGGTLSLIDLATGKQRIVLRSLLPPNDGWRSLPDDAARAVLWENEPAWSPDGEQLAFLSAHEGSADLYTYTLARDEVWRVAAGDPNAAWPRWSPDGRYLVYNTVRYFSIGGPPSGAKLWCLSPKGTRLLTPQEEEYDRFVAWVSEDAILTIFSPMSGSHDLALVDLANAGRTPLVEGTLAGYAWSDAAGLVAVLIGEGNEALLPGLYLMDPRLPTSPLQIADQMVRDPRWSPGGRYLTYRTGDDCALYDLEQGTARLVRGEWCAGTWSPYDHYLAYVDTSLKLVRVEAEDGEELSRYYQARTIRWSPDGEWLTWLRETDKGTYNLYALRPGAGRPFRAATDLPVYKWHGLGWVPSALPGPAAGLGITTTTDAGVSIPVDAARDEATEVLTFREGLFYRAPLEGDSQQRVPLACRLDRLAPEAGMVAMELFYKSLRFSPDRRWLIVENDDHAPCFLDLRAVEGRSLPGGIRVSWSPEGRQFAYVDKGTLTIHDVDRDTRQALWSAQGLYDVLWSPDGTRLATWAFSGERGKLFWVVDLQGAVHLSGTYAYSIHEPPLFWSADGQRLAVSQMKPGTNYFGWEILALEDGTPERVDWGEVLSSPDWVPNREREARIAPSNAGTFVAQAVPPSRSRDAGWWREPSTLTVVDAASGETVRAWQVDGFVPTVRWSAGDGWLVFGVLDIEDRQENCELGPCGIRSSVWRVRVDGTGDPEMVLGDGFLVETISANQSGRAVSPLPGLTVEEYALKDAPQVEPLTFEPVQETAQEILQKRRAEREKPVKRVWKTSGEMSVAFREGQLVAAEIYTNTAGGQVGAVQVTYGGSVLCTVPLGLASPVDKLRGLWVHDGHWYVEVADWQGQGQVIRDGESLNECHGYEETFGFQLLHGRPFWFFQREGQIGVSYEGQETLLGYESVVHYGCCSVAELNPIQAENMVAFFALRDGTWYYVEMGVYE